MTKEIIDESIQEPGQPTIRTDKRGEKTVSFGFRCPLDIKKLVDAEALKSRLPNGSVMVNALKNYFKVK